ncbi:hypothetical protein [Hyphococcus luteus]|nr:hypothetical protein [Marinicaulis flavus]
MTRNRVGAAILIALVVGMVMTEYAIAHHIIPSPGHAAAPAPADAAQ